MEKVTVSDQFVKARSLVASYLMITGKIDSAKKCAIIAVREIILACEYNHVESYNSTWWEKVITEINLI